MLKVLSLKLCSHSSKAIQIFIGQCGSAWYSITRKNSNHYGR